MQVRRWKIWYDDGATFGSDDGAPADAPLDGVQIIVQWYDNGNVTHCEGHDYYWWTGDCWAFGSVASLDRWLRALLPELKFGRWTRNAVHQTAIAEANAWPSQ